MPVFAKPSLALLAFALAVLAGCGSSGDSADTPSSGLPKEIVIGAAIAKTGYLEPWDSTFAAVEQLVKETNARGGIDGHQVRVVQADTHSDPQQAVLAVQKVIEEGANVLFFSGEALTAAAGSPLAEEHDKLNFAIVNEPGFGPPTTGHLSFSSNPSLLSEASADASFLFERGTRHPFLFRDTAIIYGKAGCSAFQQSWEHLGGTIAGSVDFENGDESIASQVSELRSSDADSVFMCSYPPGGAAAIKQIRAAHIDIPILGPSAFDGTFWVRGIPNMKDIYASMNGSAYDPTNEEMAKLFESLKRAGVDTDVSSGLLATYAAGQLMLDVIKETGSVEGNTLASALEAKPHKTVIGKVSYTKDDHYTTRTWPIYSYSSGKPKLVTEVKPHFIPEYGG
jgi:branched-chain amino acid transport system substrate-binding protein